MSKFDRYIQIVMLFTVY